MADKEALGDVVTRRSAERDGWWEIQVPDHGLIVKFREHGFNDTQEFSFVDADSALAELGADGVARLARLVGEWARENIPHIIF